MKISVITPSFNQASFLEQTIDSILSQGYEDLEYIIVDGGSKDGSVDIIKKYEKHLKYWVSEKDRGQSHAINKGMKHASGEVINWINSDDYLEPGALEGIARLFNDPKTQVVCGRSNIVENGKIIHQSRGTDIYKGNLPKTIGLARIDQPETWFRKSVFDHVTPLLEDLHYVMDKYLWVRYLLQYGLEQVVSTDQIFVNFRWHDTSKTKSQGDGFLNETISMYAELARVIGAKEILELLDSLFREQSTSHKFQFDVKSEIINGALHYFLLWLADLNYTTKEYRKAKEIFGIVSAAYLARSDHFWFNKLKWSIRLKLNRFKN